MLQSLKDTRNRAGEGRLRIETAPAGSHGRSPRCGTTRGPLKRNDVRMDGDNDNCDVGPFHSVTESVAAGLREKLQAQLYPERGVSRCDIDGSRLKFTRLLGGGAFSDVFEVNYIPGPGFDLERRQKVAVKLLKLEDKDEQREVVDFIREIQIMRALPERWSENNMWSQRLGESTSLS